MLFTYSLCTHTTTRTYFCAHTWQFGFLAAITDAEHMFIMRFWWQLIKFYSFGNILLFIAIYDNAANKCDASIVTHF